MEFKIGVLPGDGIGPEITAQAVKVIDAVCARYGHQAKYTYAEVGAAAIDRYGDPPASVSDLVNVSLVRVLAASVGVYEVTQKKDLLTLSLEKLDLPMIRGLLAAFDGRVTAGAGARPYLSVRLREEEKPLELLQQLLQAMAAIQDKTAAPSAPNP